MRETRLTLLETIISTTIFILIVGVAMSVLGTSQNLFTLQSRISNNNEKARIAINQLVKELTESSLQTVDTSFRSVGLLKWSNHYEDTTPGNKHCVNDQDLTPLSPKSQVSWRYSVRFNGNIKKKKSGRIWLDFPENICPIDGSFLVNNAFLDGIKFFHLKNRKGKRILNATTKELEWQAIIIYMPYRKPKAKTFELRRYVVYLEDLFAPDPIPDGVTLFGLWDLNQDNKLDDVGEFGVHSYNPNSNQIPSSIDIFEVKADSICWKKISGDQKNELTIDRKTGLTTWNVEEIEGVTKNSTFTNPPQTLVNGLLDIDISTKDTNPYNETTYPAGVSRDLVRITLLFHWPDLKTNQYSANDVLLTTEIKPRN